MSKCVSVLDFDPDSDPCERDGWPQLDGLCIEHYRDWIFAPAWGKLLDAETAWFAVRDKLYTVEVAAGLRPAIGAPLVMHESLRPPKVAKAVEINYELSDDDE